MSISARYGEPMTHAPFRFGMQVHAPLAGLSWLDSARKIEDQGYDSLLMPDHFGEQWSPIAALSGHFLLGRESG